MPCTARRPCPRFDLLPEGRLAPEDDSAIAFWLDLRALKELPPPVAGEYYEMRMGAVADRSEVVWRLRHLEGWMAEHKRAVADVN